MSQRVTCVIPAYNAAATVANVVRGLRASLGEVHVIGVDDGSTDATRAALDAVCDRVIGLAGNRGKGAALRAGFEAALARGDDAVIAIDADGQHDPACAPRLLAALASADIVVGMRARSGAMPMRRRLTNALSTAAASRLGGCAVGDAQSGYRAIRPAVLRAVQGRGDRYEYETDFLIQAGRAGFRIATVPVPTIYGPRSHFREVRDGVRVVATFLRHVRVS